MLFRLQILCGLLLAGLAPLLLPVSAANDDPNHDMHNNNGGIVGGVVTLHDQNTMPRVGLGVALSFDQTYDAVRQALKAGYRLIDTAADDTYANQDLVGTAIRDWISESEGNSNSREDVFVTTKLWDDSHGFYPAVQALGQSLRELAFHADHNYIDLYLIHSPFGGRLMETWDAMVYLQKWGKIKSIGVSNFGIPHLEALRQSGRPMPVVNQIEMHPLVYHRRLELIQYCQQHNIVVQAYGSILAGYPELLKAPRLVEMAERYNKSAAQILLKWALQHGFCIIPKSVRKERILSNIDVYDFELTPEDMNILDDWGKEYAGDEREDENVLLYKESWNWNPIDEANVEDDDSGTNHDNSYFAIQYKDVDTELVQRYLSADYQPSSSSRSGSTSSDDSDSDEEEEDSDDSDDAWGYDEYEGDEL